MGCGFSTEAAQGDGDGAIPAESVILRRTPPAWFDGEKVELSTHAKSEFDEGTGFSSVYYTLKYNGEEKWKSMFASSSSNAGGARGDHLDVKLRHNNRVLIVTTGKLSGRATTNLQTSAFDVAELVQD